MIYSILLKVIASAGVLAMIYRLYLAFVQGHETAIENKNSKQVQSDLERNKADADQVKKSTDDFNDLVNEFERNNKK